MSDIHAARVVQLGDCAYHHAPNPVPLVHWVKPGLA
jgi:hypothetical protein